jgi:hypothetical protein
MSAKLKVEDVFKTSPPSTEDITYVDRSAQEKVRELREALRKTGVLIRVYGDSKSGKTTFCRNFLDDRHPIFVQGVMIKDQKQFVDMVTQQMPERAVGGGATQDPFTQFATLKRYKIAILVDNFQKMPEDLRRHTIDYLRASLDEGVTGVVISVKDISRQIIASHRDLQGGSPPIRIPSWKESELAQIAKKGFEALRIVGVNERALTANAFSNPLIMQNLCVKICNHLKVAELQDKPLRGAIDDAKLGAIISQYAFEIGDFYSGFRNRGTLYNLRLGLTRRQADLTSLIYLALGESTLFQAFQFNTLVERIESYCGDGSRPTRQNIGKQLSALVDELNSADDECLTYNQSTRDVCVTSPHFMLYLKWSLWPNFGARPPLT